MTNPESGDQAVAAKLAGLSALADNLNLTHDPTARRLADQIGASDPGVFAQGEVSAIVQATIALCTAAGVDPADAGPHVIETVLGRRELATELKRSK